MTRKGVIVFVAVVAVLLAVAVYVIFFMPTEQVYDGVLIDNMTKQELLRGCNL